MLSRPWPLPSVAVHTLGGPGRAARKPQPGPQAWAWGGPNQWQPYKSFNGNGLYHYW